MTKLEELQTKRTKCQVFSRNNGYLQPIENWNPGKSEEWKQRKTFDKTLKDA